MNFSMDTANRFRARAGHQTRRPTLRARVARIGSAIWRSLEAVGRARAQRELRMLAARYETTQPELAKQLRAAGRNCARHGP